MSLNFNNNNPINNTQTIIITFHWIASELPNGNPTSPSPQPFKTRARAPSQAFIFAIQKLYRTIGTSREFVSYRTDSPSFDWEDTCSTRAIRCGETQLGVPTVRSVVRQQTELT